MRKTVGAAVALISLLLFAPACEGPAGPAGEPGTDGADGAPCYEGLGDVNGDGVVDVLDCRGRDGRDALNGWPVLDDSEIAAIKSREGVIKNLLKKAEHSVSEQLPARLQQAQANASEKLQAEIDRLRALKTVNPNVREEEIQFFEQRLRLALQQIEDANIRLDAIRVLVAI